MHFEILRFSDLAPALVHSWDRLAAGRGLHADLYSSHAWLVAWVQAMGAEVAAALRIPAVLGPDQPVALLPLVARSSRRWEWAGKGGSRMRYRPVLAAEQPSPGPASTTWRCTGSRPGTWPPTGWWPRCAKLASTPPGAGPPVTAWQWLRVAGTSIGAASPAMNGRSSGWSSGWFRSGR